MIDFAMVVIPGPAQSEPGIQESYLEWVTDHLRLRASALTAMGAPTRDSSLHSMRAQSSS